MKKKLTPVFIVLLGIVLMVGITKLKKESPKFSRPPKVRSLSVTDVKFGLSSPAITALGRIRSTNKLNLSAEVSGKVISSNFKLKKGYNFKRGEVLLKIDDTQASNNLKIGISDLLNSLIEILPDIKIDLPDEYEKWQSFFDEISFKNLPKLPEINSSREKMFLTRYGFLNRYFLVSNRYDMYKKHTIRAPFDGTVGDVRINVGNMVSPGMAFATIIRTDKYEIELSLLPKEVSFVSVGMPVEVSLTDSKKKVKGIISRVSRYLNERSQTQEVIVTLLGNTEVIDGEYAEVFIHGKKINSFVLPKGALYKKKYVLVIEDISMQKHNVEKQLKSNRKEKVKNSISKDFEAGRLTLREVEIAFLGKDYAYVTSGVQDGEVVVNVPTQDISEDMLVSPVRERK